MQWIDAVLAGLFTMLTWFVRRTIATNDKAHAENAAAIRTLEKEHAASEQRLTDHISHDDERFEWIKTGVETIQSDIKLLLQQRAAGMNGDGRR